jgi:transposase
MSTHAQDTWSIPAETARLARVTYPAGTLAMRLRDELEDFLDEPLALFFHAPGSPAEAPARLVVVLVLQSLERLTDEQAAASVRTRVDWKYALGLRLDDPGLDASVLSAFRRRLLEANVSILLLHSLSEYCTQRGWLSSEGT